MTAREVTRRAHANLASIGYHFGSMHGLVTEALVLEVEELVAPVLGLLASERDATSRAGDAVVLLNETFATIRTRVPAYLAALAVVPHEPAVRTRLAAVVADIRGRLAADIERQAAAAALPGWVDPVAMASLVVAVVTGVVVAAALEPTAPPGTDHEAVAGQFLFLLLAARAAS